MIILHVEHDTLDFDTWKRNFDADPVDRAERGVRSYTVSRRLDQPNRVAVDLHFDTAEQAQGLLDALAGVWERMLAPHGITPTATIFAVVETVELASI